MLTAAVVVVVCVDLGAVAATDQDLDRVGLVSGASVYPLAWNMLLAARQEGFGGTFTTMAIAEEPRVKELLGIPEQYAVAAVVRSGDRSSSPRATPPALRGVRDAGALRRRAVHRVNTQEILQLLQDVAEEVINPRFRTLTDDQVAEKNPGDLVTIADHEAEVRITEALSSAYPDALVLGEEATATDDELLARFRDADHAFTVDPVDGTKNFVARLPGPRRDGGRASRR